jgi:predicted O-methyltransferase YrrM
MYKFTHNWFNPNIENLTKIFIGYTADKPPNILEVGALEGMSTTWFLDRVPGCTVTTIDNWCGGKDHDSNNTDINFIEIEQNFINNIARHKARITVIKDDSYSALSKLVAEQKKFDFVFIDGSHTAIDVNLDLILSFKLLEVGGVLYADDYLWGFSDRSIYDSPKLGIDSFVNVYADKLRPMKALSNQAAVYIKRSE